MTKTKITEITEKFDKEGRVIERITRTEESNDDTNYFPYYPLTTAENPSIIKNNHSVISNQQTAFTSTKGEYHG